MPTAPSASAIFAGHFKGRHVVVTGAAVGIGRCVGFAFAEAGATVHLVDRSEQVLATAAEAAAAGLDVTGSVVDVTDVSQVDALFDSLAERWGKLDVLVNNAGVITIAPLADTTTDDFARVLAVNTTAQFTAIRAAQPLLRAAGGGAIVNAASGQARQGFIYTPGYAASKFGVIGLTQSLAKELAVDNIRVNAYCPGIVATDMWAYNDAQWGRLLGDFAPGELMAKWVSEIPMGRAAAASDVANAILFLASDAGNYITGQAINVDGGMFMN
jgi:meso-butanediol dehydrogenase/(S,S)-butanediol dehydrogenase/diacetyl reductase